MKRVRIFIIFLSVGMFVMQSLSAQTFGKRFIEKEKAEEEKPESGVRTAREYELRDAQIREIPLENPIDPDQYIVGPGDKFGISILSEKSIAYSVAVSPSGELLIPAVGTYHVSGKRLTQVLKGVQDFIKENAYATARVSICLMDLRRFLVQISGAVNSPGFYIITPVTRLDKIIELAGGFHPFAEEFNIIVFRKNGTQEKINFIDYLIEGDLAHNPTFLEGDKIVVPYGDIEESGVVIRGSIETQGYDIIQENESLGSFLTRRADYDENVDLESVTITRLNKGSEKIITIYPEDFNQTILKAGDEIDVQSQHGVSVNGFVRAPGGYNFIPGYTCADYIGLAGGNTVEGDIDKVVVRHLDGKMERGLDVLIRRGDVVLVPRTTKNILFGDSSILQIVSAVTSIVLTFIAATRQYK